MHRIRIVARASTAAVLVAVMAAALFPAYAAAATRPIMLDVMMGEECIYGTASDGATLQLLWKSATGSRKAKTSVQASATDGWWRACSPAGDVVAIGDRITANDGTSSHVLVVPELTLVINRVDDRFKGRGPAGDYVRLICGYTNGFEPCQATWKLKVNSQGQWGLRPGWDLVGWQSMNLLWRSAGGDRVNIYMQGPYLDLTIGSAVVRGASRANAPVTVVLRRAGSNDVAATAVTKASSLGGAFQTKFRNQNGKAVKVRAGDRVTSDVAPDEDWIVPNVTASADAASDIVTGTCPADSMFVHVTVVRNGYEDGRSGWPEEDNTFNKDLTEQDIQAGEAVRASCFTLPLGDWVGRAIVAE